MIQSLSSVVTYSKLRPHTTDITVWNPYFKKKKEIDFHKTKLDAKFRKHTNATCSLGIIGSLIPNLSCVAHNRSFR